ncbi:transglycosylase [Salinisphaera orenii MK-B5]|uniref:Transglycosylase n=1 Tax=Salinisphaera orenii MK-B5 TaxID=856730 RepID=A0A423PQ83_9GAMM|nr:lytic transglycosylase domain-containing protein [Salinisphaera orenii]ROO27718.1 transglycosylase [Salinisphaera orenii MK-B5]
MRPAAAVAAGLVVAGALMPISRASAAAAARESVDPALREQLTTAVDDATSFDNRFAAEVWLLDMATRLAPQMPDAGRRMALLKTVHAEATRAGLSPQLVLALIQVESAFKRFAVSSAGARGLMQIMPFWIEEIGRPDDNLFDMRTNLRYGCTILAYYLDKEDGNVVRALARYNGSLGETWYPARVERALRTRWYGR